jgi:hypothetical protein
MNSYERALEAARVAPLSLPDFDAIAVAAGEARVTRDRAMVSDRQRARRWLLVCAAAWLLLPLESLEFLLIVEFDLSKIAPFLLNLALMVALPAMISVWGAWLLRPRERSFRAAMLVRAIAASNLLVALLYAVSVGGMAGGVYACLLALASARTLTLLGVDGLDDSEGLDGLEPDASVEFAPVRFRGILTAALILASADVLTLVFSSSVAAAETLHQAQFGHRFGDELLLLTLTVGAAALMLINVWGLLRLRTWALLSNMVANLAIAGLALSGQLAANIVVALGLTATAGLQLLLVVPILATALGDRGAGRTHARLGPWLRWLIPVLVIATVTAATFNLDVAFPHEWIYSP